MKLRQIKDKLQDQGSNSLGFTIVACQQLEITASICTYLEYLGHFIPLFLFLLPISQGLRNMKGIFH